MLIMREMRMSKAEDLADMEWRKISKQYAKHTKEDYLAMYKLFLSAFIKGYNKGGLVK